MLRPTLTWGLHWVGSVIISHTGMNISNHNHSSLVSEMLTASVFLHLVTVQCHKLVFNVHFSSEQDECASSPCTNSGRCTSKPFGYSCSCGQDWYGDRCQFSVTGMVYACIVDDTVKSSKRCPGEKMLANIPQLTDDKAIVHQTQKGHFLHIVYSETCCILAYTRRVGHYFGRTLLGAFTVTAIKENIDQLWAIGSNHIRVVAACGGQVVFLFPTPIRK